MNIKKVAVKNFRVFKEQSFDLRPITVVVGPNSAGKSSLFKALQLLKDNIEEPEHLFFTNKKHALNSFDSVLNHSSKANNDRVIAFAVEGYLPKTENSTLLPHEENKMQIEFSYTSKNDKIIDFNQPAYLQKLTITLEGIEIASIAEDSKDTRSKNKDSAEQDEKKWVLSIHILNILNFYKVQNSSLLVYSLHKFVHSSNKFQEGINTFLKSIETDEIDFEISQIETDLVILEKQNQEIENKILSEQKHPKTKQQDSAKREDKLQKDIDNLRTQQTKQDSELVSQKEKEGITSEESLDIDKKREKLYEEYKNQIQELEAELKNVRKAPEENGKKRSHTIDNSIFQQYPEWIKNKNAIVKAENTKSVLEHRKAQIEDKNYTPELSEEKFMASFLVELLKIAEGHVVEAGNADTNEDEEPEFNSEDGLVWGLQPTFSSIEQIDVNGLLGSFREYFAISDNKSSEFIAQKLTNLTVKDIAPAKYKDTDFGNSMSVAELFSEDDMTDVLLVYLRKVLNDVIFLFKGLPETLPVHFLPSFRGEQSHFFVSEGGYLSDSIFEIYRQNQIVGKQGKNNNENFYNKWLKEFEIGKELKISKVQNTGSYLFAEIDGEPLSDLGFGISQVLPIILKTVAIGNRSTNNKQFIMVEEPESHLHPLLQSRLADFFKESVEKFNNLNFILETHSIHFILKLQVLVAEGKLNPENVLIYYLGKNADTKDLECKRIEIDEYGDLTDKFGTGFIDESSKLLGKLWKAQNL
ncbi:MAG: AAA family ATPase [Bernardetiaceae bacterium]|nr:AAA family ATPase [Bernardetiaceae bacterium]